MLNVLIEIGRLCKEVGVKGQITMTVEQYDALTDEADQAQYRPDPMQPVQVNGITIEVDYR